MENSNRIKSEKLGMSFSTANAILRKTIMFELAKKCNLDTCYRCHKKIESIDELSIEHKEAWLHSDDPVDNFFNIDNIAFSHLKCNISAKRTVPKNRRSNEYEKDNIGTTGYKYVYEDERKKKPFYIRIRIGKKFKRFGGSFAKAIEAAKKADEVIKENKLDMPTNKELGLLD